MPGIFFALKVEDGRKFDRQRAKVKVHLQRGRPYLEQRGDVATRLFVARVVALRRIIP